MRCGSVSSAAVMPASRLNWRSMFQMRSPVSLRRSTLQSPAQAASTMLATSSSPQIIMGKAQMPTESMAAFESWLSFTIFALPSSLPPEKSSS